MRLAAVGTNVFLYLALTLCLLLLLCALIFFLTLRRLCRRFKRFPDQPRPEDFRGKDPAELAPAYLRKDGEAERWFAAQLPSFESLYLKSADGLRLHAWLLEVPGAKHAAVVCHGYSDNLGKIALYARYFHERKWTCLIIDQRAHGFSEGGQISMSVREQDDIAAWTRLLDARLPDLEAIVLLGWSMGAASVLMLADRPLPKLAGIIADSSYSAMRDLKLARKSGTRVNALLRLFYPLLCAVYKRRRGIDFRLASPITHVRRALYPILYLHGDADRVVPIAHGERLYAATPAEKFWLRAAGCAHVRGIFERHADYVRAMDDFLAYLAQTGRMRRPGLDQQAEFPAG